MPEGGGPGPEVNTGSVNESPKITRKTFLKGGAVVVGVAAALGVGELVKRGLDRKVERYRIESGWQGQTVEVDGAKVELSWVEAKPKGKENIDLTKAVINLPPWSWAAETPIIRGGGQKIADGMGENTFTISTRTDKIHPDALFTEAQGIAKFILDRGIQEVTIFSHSEGGVKAVNLAAILEANYPQVKVNMVVLLNPMGMDARSVLSLGKSFFSDIFKVGPAEFERAKKLPPEGGAVQFLLSLWQDMRFFGMRYPEALMEEAKAMARPNPRLSQIKAPVLLLTGEQDFVSDFRRYFPQEEVEKRLKATLSDEQLRGWIGSKSKWEHLPTEEQQKFGSKEKFVAHYMQAYRKQEEMVRWGRAHNQYMGEKIVPGAENSIFLLATKPAASHTGLPDTRFERVLKIARKIFPRFKRQAAPAG